MKSFKSRLAIIVAMMVFVTSFTFIGVSAEDANQLEAPAAEAIATPAANEGGNQQAIKVVSPVTGLVSYSSYESVVLEWNKSVVTTTETDKDGIPLPPTEAQYTVNGLDVGKAHIIEYHIDAAGNPALIADKILVIQRLFADGFLQACVLLDHLVLTDSKAVVQLALLMHHTTIVGSSVQD